MAPPTFWSEVLNLNLWLAHELAQQPPQDHRKIRVEAEEARVENFFGKDCGYMVCSNTLFPAWEKRGLSQVRESSMRQFRWPDSVSWSLWAKTWGSLDTWKSPKVREVAPKGLATDEEEELVLGRHWPPFVECLLHEAHVWAMCRSGQPRRGTEAAWGGTTDSEGTSEDGERAQVADEGSEEPTKVPHKRISTISSKQ